jgi:hypothetical protein
MGSLTLPEHLSISRLSPAAGERVNVESCTEALHSDNSDGARGGNESAPVRKSTLQIIDSVESAKFCTQQSEFPTDGCQVKF